MKTLIQKIKSADTYEKFQIMNLFFGVLLIFVGGMAVGALLAKFTLTGVWGQ